MEAVPLKWHSPGAPGLPHFSEAGICFLLMFIQEDSDNGLMAVGLRALEPGQPDLQAGVTASTGLFFCAHSFRRVIAASTGQTMMRVRVAVVGAGVLHRL